MPTKNKQRSRFGMVHIAIECVENEAGTGYDFGEYKKQSMIFLLSS